MVTGNGDKIFHLGAYSLQSWTVDRRLSHPLSFLSNTHTHTHTFQYPDYYDIVETPMDLRMIKNKIKCHDYNNLDEFLLDMLLIFDNCLQYHKRHSKIGKDGAALKRYFEKRCANLGLRDLSLCSPIVNIGTDNSNQSARRVSTRNRK